MKTYRNRWEIDGRRQEIAAFLEFFHQNPVPQIIWVVDQEDRIQILDHVSHVGLIFNTCNAISDAWRDRYRRLFPGLRFRMDQESPY